MPYFIVLALLTLTSCAVDRYPDSADENLIPEEEEVRGIDEQTLEDPREVDYDGIHEIDEDGGPYDIDGVYIPDDE